MISELKGDSRTLKSNATNGMVSIWVMKQALCSGVYSIY